MQRFILQENILRYERLLQTSVDETVRRQVHNLLLKERRQLALYNAATDGAYPAKHLDRRVFLDKSEDLLILQRALEGSARALLIIDPGPGLHIVDCNSSFTAATLTTGAKIAGQPLFSVFPDNPDDPAADGVSNVFASLNTVVQTGQTHVMKIQRYDLRDAEGRFTEYYWRSTNSPVFDEHGQLAYVLHQAEDVTDLVRQTRAEAQSDRRGTL